MIADFIGGQSDLNSFPFGSYCYQNSCGGAPPFESYSSRATRHRERPTSDTSRILRTASRGTCSIPTLGAQYHFTDDVMAYASWGKGFKQGGWTTRLSAAITSPSAARFSPEYSKTYELGLKSQWFEHRLQANAAVFFTNYDGIQLNIQRGISPVYTNAGNADIKGAELEVQSNVGGGLSLNFNAAYIDAYYTYVNPSANIPQYALPGSGLTVCPGSPALTGCAMQGTGTASSMPSCRRRPSASSPLIHSTTCTLPNEAILRFIPAYTYTSGSVQRLAEYAAAVPPGNAHAGCFHSLRVADSSKYDLAIGGTNLLNDRFITAGSPNYGAGEVGGYYNDPRRVVPYSAREVLIATSANRSSQRVSGAATGARVQAVEA